MLPQNVRSFRMPQTLFPKNTGLHQDLKQLRGMRKSMVCVDARFAKSSHLLCLPILSCQKLRLTICQSGGKAKKFSPKFWDTCKESKLENCILLNINIAKNRVVSGAFLHRFFLSFSCLAAVLEQSLSCFLLGCLTPFRS